MLGAGVRVGAFATIGAYVVIGARAEIGEGCTLAEASIICHDAKLGAGTCVSRLEVVAPHATLAPDSVI